MADFTGKFVWFELLTTDTAAAKSFYGTVAGWGTQPGPVPGMAYSMFTAGGMPVGGVMTLPDEAKKAGAPPHWTGVVGVENVDIAVEKVVRLGGSQHMPAMDIPSVGRYAVVADPQGAAFGLFMPLTQPTPDCAPPSGAGTFGWHELHAADAQAAFGFYETMFGWTKSTAHDMGPMGVYQTFAAADQAMGGMFTKPPEEPAPYWLYYITVGDIDAAAARVGGGGGKVLNGPMQVPGGGWILHASDPQGVAFALLGTRG